VMHPDLWRKFGPKDPEDALPLGRMIRS